MNAVTAQCPVCNTPITQTRYAEIQERIRKEEQGKLALQAERLRLQHAAAMKTAIQAAAKRATEEGRTLDKTVQDVVARYFEEEDRFIEAVKRGEAALERGEFLNA